VGVLRAVGGVRGAAPCHKLCGGAVGGGWAFCRPRRRRRPHSPRPLPRPRATPGRPGLPPRGLMQRRLAPAPCTRQRDSAQSPTWVLAYTAPCCARGRGLEFAGGGVVGRPPAALGAKQGSEEAVSCVCAGGGSSRGRARGGWWERWRRPRRRGARGPCRRWRRPWRAGGPGVEQGVAVCGGARRGGRALHAGAVRRGAARPPGVMGRERHTGARRGGEGAAAGAGAPAGRQAAARARRRWQRQRG
jgi:hypothetical protein